MSKTSMSKTGISKSGISKTSMSKTGISKSGISKTSMAKTSISKSSMSKTSIAKTSIGSMVEGWCVVDQRGWCRQDSCGSSKDCGVSFTLLSVSSSGSSSYKSSSMGSLGLSNLRGVNNGCRGNTGVNRGNKRFWVEGGCNTGVNWGNREVRVEDWKTRVSDTESCTISNVFNLLKLTIGINIRVSSSNSGIGVSGLLLSRVQVGITVVQVSKLILGLELAARHIRGIWGSIWSSIRSSSNCWGSSIWQTSIGILCSSTAEKGRNGDKSSHDYDCCQLCDAKRCPH